jgi:calcineurin-like phosphoesterase family protein
MKTFVISDTHFNHRNIIRYCNRPFVTVEQMNQQLILNWNSVVSPEDTVWHVGDFGFGDLSSINGQLNGHVHLIQGNHDSSVTWNSFNFASRQRWQLLELNGLRVLLTHFPVHQPDSVRSIPSRLEYDVCLYGHVHQTESGWIESHNRWYRNCSVEVLEYRPQPLLELLQSCPVTFSQLQNAQKHVSEREI